MSSVTPTTPCKGASSGSFISMSAPPPTWPMLVFALVSRCVRPADGPVMTETVIVLSLGSARPDGRLVSEPSSKSAFLANNATSSRSAGMALVRKPAGGLQTQVVPLLRDKNLLSIAPARRLGPRSQCFGHQFGSFWGTICPHTSATLSTKRWTIQQPE